MKANEAPEKIILSADRDTQIINDEWVINYYTDNIKIEYTRTDAFIDKACRAIEKLLSGYIIRNFNFGDSYDIDRLIEDFKKAMEEYVMARLIDIDALVAEIEKMRDKAYPQSDWNRGYTTSCEKILSLIDTLEVKEVDLEKEIQQHINDCLDIKFPTTDTKIIAKDVEYTARKFFELGLKAQKGE